MFASTGKFIHQVKMYADPSSRVYVILRIRFAFFVPIFLDYTYVIICPSIRLSVSSEMCQMVCIRCLINMLFATNWLTVSVYKKKFRVHSHGHAFPYRCHLFWRNTNASSPITSLFRVPRLGNLNSLDTQHMSTTH